MSRENEWILETPNLPQLHKMMLGKNRHSRLSPKGHRWIKRVARISRNTMTVMNGDPVVVIAGVMQWFGGSKDSIEAWNTDFDTAYYILGAQIESARRACLPSPLEVQAPAPPDSAASPEALAAAEVAPLSAAEVAPLSAAEVALLSAAELPLADLPEIVTYEEQRARNHAILIGEQRRYRREWDEYMSKWRAKKRCERKEREELALKARHIAVCNEWDETIRRFRARTGAPHDGRSIIRRARLSR